MDVFNLLSYINKISLFAFFITTMVVVYQIYTLRKEKSKEKAPSIPDFKERSYQSGVANYTNLPDSMLVKEIKKANYSKLIFSIIALLTLVIIIVVVTLINRNKIPGDQALNKPTPTITKSPSLVKPSSNPTPTVSSSSNLTPTGTLTEGTPIAEPTLTSIPSLTPTNEPIIIPATVEPTEIIIAEAPTSTPATSTNDNTTPSVPQTLPETGSVKKVLLIFGVAISTIFFSFFL